MRATHPHELHWRPSSSNVVVEFMCNSRLDWVERDNDPDHRAGKSDHCVQIPHASPASRASLCYHAIRRVSHVFEKSICFRMIHRSFYSIKTELGYLEKESKGKSISVSFVLDMFRATHNPGNKYPRHRGGNRKPGHAGTLPGFRSRCELRNHYL